MVVIMLATMDFVRLLDNLRDLLEEGRFET